MAQIDAEAAPQKYRAGVRKMIKNNLRVDMTPMVDLGFLLIAFFVLTTELSKPTVMNLNMPKTEGTPTPVGDSYALTVLLGAKSYYYEGDWDKAFSSGKVFSVTSYELRKIIARKQQQLDDKTKYKFGRNGLMLLVKPTAAANYKTIVDMLDETTIANVKSYALVDATDNEKEWLSKNP
ncbi:MAG: biopolymer transporter ExbD [Chitinophagaceae bacterium]|nr:biopolymer transporter ExbD [Chitinophagaceae bacterium]